MVLTDDNFATIVSAVREGRNVFSNIKRTVYFLLACNLSEIAVMLGAQLMGWGTPLTSRDAAAHQRAGRRHPRPQPRQ